jgi:hypothetical protein
VGITTIKLPAELLVDDCELESDMLVEGEHTPASETKESGDTKSTELNLDSPSSYIGKRKSSVAAEKLWSEMGVNSSNHSSKFSRPSGVANLDEPIRKRDFKAQSKMPLFTTKYDSVPVELHSKAAKYDDILLPHEMPSLSVPTNPLRVTTPCKNKPENGKRFFNSLLAKA